MTLSGHRNSLRKRQNAARVGAHIATASDQFPRFARGAVRSFGTFPVAILLAAIDRPRATTSASGVKFQLVSPVLTPSSDNSALSARCGAGR